MDNRLFFSATQRNSHAIGDVLSSFLLSSGSVLEIGSGSGEHGVIFQKRFPEINWQTSDPALINRLSISSWIAHYGLTERMHRPLDIDVETRPWPLTSKFRRDLKAVICINMIHISPWTCTKALFEESANLLKKQQFLMLYGPFKREGIHTSKSNFIFDQSLKRQNEDWGVRDLEQVNQLAIKNGFTENYVFQMPANNLSIIFRMR